MFDAVVKAAGRRKSNLTESLLDAFFDAPWLEDGLAKNSIASYRADLEQLAAFLNDGLLKAGETELYAFLASRKGRATRATRRVSNLKPIYRHYLHGRAIGASP